MKIGILTGGGDCPGLNQAIRGVVLRAIEGGHEIIGLKEGWKGLIEKTTQCVGIEDVDEIIDKGGTILGTSRTNPLKRENGITLCKEAWDQIGLDALIAIGGNDTLSVASALCNEGLKVVGIPKTMDNDLSCTDYTFGFDTSVTIAIDALGRLRDTGRSHQRIMVLEVMGRDAGWVALFTAIGGGADWVLLPEFEVDIDKMCEHLKKVYARKHYGSIVVSEGIRLDKVSSTVEDQTDEFGHPIHRARGVGETIADEILARTGISTRSAVIGHIQRGGSPTLFDRILAIRVGVAAVEMVENGQFGQMAALVGNEIKSVFLEKAAGELKTVNADWQKLAMVVFK